MPPWSFINSHLYRISELFILLHLFICMLIPYEGFVVCFEIFCHYFSLYLFLGSSCTFSPHISFNVWHCILHCKQKYWCFASRLSSIPLSGCYSCWQSLSAMFICNKHKSVFFHQNLGLSVCFKEFYWWLHQWPKCVGSVCFLNGWPARWVRNSIAIGLGWLHLQGLYFSAKTGYT